MKGGTVYCTRVKSTNLIRCSPEPAPSTAAERVTSHEHGHVPITQGTIQLWSEGLWLQNGNSGVGVKYNRNKI